MMQQHRWLRMGLMHRLPVVHRRRSDVGYEAVELLAVAFVDSRRMCCSVQS